MKKIDDAAPAPQRRCVEPDGTEPTAAAVRLPKLSRRTLVGGMAGLATLGALGADMLAAPPAHAALRYGIPPGNPQTVWDSENGVVTHDAYTSWQFHLNRTNQQRGGVDMDGDTGDPLHAPIDCHVHHYNGGAGIAVRMYAADGSGWSDVYDHMNSIGVPHGTFVPFGGYVGELGGTWGYASHLHWHRLDPNGVRRIPWNYFTDGSSNPGPTPGGFLMALTDQQQDEIYMWMKNSQRTVLSFVAADASSAWWVTDGMTKRKLGPGENQLLIDLGIIKWYDGVVGNVKLIGQAALDRIPTQV